MRKIVSFMAVMLCAVSLFADYVDNIGICWSDDNLTLKRYPYNGPASIDLQSTTIHEIGDRAFSACTQLVSVILPNTVTTIGERAFYKCRNLSITIPVSVTSIGEGAFVGVKSVQFAADTMFFRIDSNGALISIEEQINGGSGWQITKGTLLYVPCNKTGEYTIPHGVTRIGMGAFGECRNLTGIIIPASVTTIGDGAFYKCSSLTSITIPDSVTTIGRNAFYGCSSLTRIEIPGNCNIDNAHLPAGCQVIRR